MRLNSVKYLFKQGTRNIASNKHGFCIILCSFSFTIACRIFTFILYEYKFFVAGVEAKNEVIVFLEEDTTDELLTVSIKALNP